MNDMFAIDNHDIGGLTYNFTYCHSTMLFSQSNATLDFIRQSGDVHYRHAPYRENETMMCIINISNIFSPLTIKLLRA